MGVQPVIFPMILIIGICFSRSNYSSDKAIDFL